ncbi:MAG: HD domain-containing phosphohydrolase [Candidatus Promineifilaceae bacterium]|nr:HD domain-containing phosphohydrolase [Candidatus Promineifilaceae bacterium]
MKDTSVDSAPLRLAELMAALSIATDLCMGQPMEHAMRTSIVALRLGEAAGLNDLELRDVYYEAQLRYIGCNADTYWLSSLVGDEIALRSEYAKIDTADMESTVEMVVRYIRQANAGANPQQIAQIIDQKMAELPLVTTSFFPGHCEVAKRLATRLNFPDSFVQTVGQIYARWDGQGVPPLKGEAISTAMLVASLAHDVVIFYNMGGVAAATAMAHERSGGAHAPRLVEIFCAKAAELLAGVDTEPTWQTVLALEPGPQLTLDEPAFDNACIAIADFTDIKSPYFLNHSRHVADLAAQAARQYGLPPGDVQLVRRAGFIHDIGKIGISAGIWGKPGLLTIREWEKVRLHPYYTERILARPAKLANIGALAALHHERLDGSGYFRGISAPMLSPAARILAAANTYCALTELRAHRPALSPEHAADELARAVRAGLLDGDAVKAVCVAAGQQSPTIKKERVAGLSKREIEVLRLLARGYTMKKIAAELTIAYKTVDRHIQNIYTKINVSTRAGATLFAMENHLLA